MQVNQQLDHPGVIAPPPLIFLGSILIGVALKFVWPIGMISETNQALVGIIFMVLGASLTTWAFRTFLNAQTNIEPYKPTTKMVTSGPYRHTRNPMYVSMSIVQIGLAILFNNPWIAIMLIPALLIIYFGVVLREERYLEKKFGKEYLDYKSSVRRWI